MSETAPDHVTIDIYSDVMCPWCAIGYGQLTKALTELDGELEAEIRWRPFELNPDMAVEGEQQEAHLQRKYRRSAEEGAKVRGQMKSIADGAGVNLSYDGDESDPVAMASAAFMVTRPSKEAAEKARKIIETGEMIRE